MYCEIIDGTSHYNYEDEELMPTIEDLEDAKIIKYDDLVIKIKNENKVFLITKKKLFNYYDYEVLDILNDRASKKSIIICQAESETED